MGSEPIFVSIPHGGWKVAPEIEAVWGLSKYDSFHDGDPFTARIYDFSDRVREQLVMEYYRAVIDLNRRPDDIAPQNPDGVVKSHTCYNVEVYKPGGFPDETLKQTLLRNYYDPYHEALDRAMARDDIRMGVDCHSMAAVSPPIEKDAGTPRPLFCLGNLGDGKGEICEPFNRLTCPPEMIRFVTEEFERVFRHEDVELDVPAVSSANIPWSGGYITQRVGGGPIPFFQIEMSRVLYLAKPHYDDETLEIDERRIRDLNEKVWSVLKKTVAWLPSPKA